MKKLSLAILAMLMMLTLASCGNTETEETPTTDTPAVETPSEETPVTDETK